MLVKVVLEWSGPARFDEWIDVAVEPVRIGTKSFDLRYRATVDGRPACEAVITYVAIKPGTNDSIELPDDVRAALAPSTRRRGPEGPLPRATTRCRCWFLPCISHRRTWRWWRDARPM